MGVLGSSACMFGVEGRLIAGRRRLRQARVPYDGQDSEKCHQQIRSDKSVEVRSRSAVAAKGPMIAATRPPASTVLMARAR